MAGKKPFFITGAHAVIRLNDVPVAFATGVSYRVTVDHASPRVLGRFEVDVHQPLKYDVSGALTVIRYTSDAVTAVGIPHPSAPNIGNNTESYSTGHSNPQIAQVIGNSNGNPHESFDPSKMFQSKMFDIDIYQTINGVNSQISKLRDCRLVETEFNLSKKSAASQSYRFVAIYMDDDGTVVGKSGVGQELS